MAKVGRPLRYSTPELMQKKIDEYFRLCDKKKEPYTVTGLTLFLDFNDRHALLEYAERGEFSAIVKKAKTNIEDYLIKNSMKNKINVTATIFNLKNNFGYADKQEIKHDGSMVTVNVSKKEGGV